MNWPLRLLLIAMVMLILILQYRLWSGRGSLAEVAHLRHQLQQQQQRIDQMRARNERLRAEVYSLKTDLQAVEARARSDLGMIKEGETFFQIVEPADAP